MACKVIGYILLGVAVLIGLFWLFSDSEGENYFYGETKMSTEQDKDYEMHLIGQFLLFVAGLCLVGGLIAVFKCD